MQSQVNNDQVPHLVIQSDEEIYQKFQELKEKVMNLKESNRIIESRLDVLCRGVGDREQTQCPECKRQKEDEAELVKALQEKAKALEEQERHQEDEMKKLGESLKTVMTNFDKLLEIAKKITSPSGQKSNQEDLATVHSETRRMGSFEHKGSTSQDIKQAECAQPIDMNIDNERNRDDAHSDNLTQSTQKLSAKSDLGQKYNSLVTHLSGRADGKNMDHADTRDQTCPNANIDPEPDHSVNRSISLQGEEHQATQVPETKNQQTEKRNKLVHQATQVPETKNQQTEKRNKLVHQSANQPIVGCLTEDVGHSQNSGASRERGTDSVIASVTEIHDIQTPGPQQTLNQQAKHSSSDKNRRLKVEITGDNFQEALQPVTDTNAGVAVENNSSEHGSIKNPNFQRKSQNPGSKESQQH